MGQDGSGPRSRRVNDHDDIWDDGPPSKEELREAAALAHALDRGSARDALPEDALQTAALIQHAAGALALDDARAEALLTEALASAKSRRPRAATSSQWWRWLVPSGLAVAAAAMLIVVWGAERMPDQSAHLPLPPMAVLRAQARAATGDGDALDRAMEDHRARVLASLEEHYR